MTTKETKSPSVPVAVLPKRTVLDLGAYDGNASSQFVHLAEQWILVDNREYEKYGWGSPVIPEGATYIEMDIMDYLIPAEIVVCSNVLYHMPNPQALLRHLRKLTIETLILTTYFDEGDKGWNYYGKENPAHPHRGTAETIYYRPTLSALLEGLREVGFKNIKFGDSHAPKPSRMLATVECS